MKYVDEFRDPRLCQQLVKRIRETVRSPRTIMEVCGGQTHGLLEQGIDRALLGCVELLHGPGCPVCVTPAEAIDCAIALSLRPQTVLVTFGDMLRVPGTRDSLRSAQSQGGQVRIVYSPLDAVRMAERDPNGEYIFFAVGFETTAPATALAVMQAVQLGLRNFSMLVCHMRVLPGLYAILSDERHRVEAILAAGHVCTIDGYRDYESLVHRFHVPVVVTGFEPVDLLSGILESVEQLERDEARVVNRYSRHVSIDGNQFAKEWIRQVYEPCDQVWRGMAVVAEGGLQLRSRWASYCAIQRFGLDLSPVVSAGDGKCRSGDVLAGRMKPPECEYFGRGCTPESPMGAPMVSSEGACSAYYRCRPPQGKFSE